MDIKVAFNYDQRALRFVTIAAMRWGAYSELIRNYSSQEYTTFHSTFHAIYSACISESVHTHTRNTTYANAYGRSARRKYVCAYKRWRKLGRVDRILCIRTINYTSFKRRANGIRPKIQKSWKFAQKKYQIRFVNILFFIIRVAWLPKPIASTLFDADLESVKT